jgi:hypothetical protein
MRSVLQALVGVLVVGCAPYVQPDSAREGELKMGDLASSLEVGIAADEVRLAFHVTNTSAAAVEFTFPTSQRYDFVVETVDGIPVWRWSGDRMFAQMLTVARLEPGETWTMEAAWPSAGRVGAHVAVARLVDMGATVEQRTGFELP